MVSRDTLPFNPAFGLGTKVTSSFVCLHLRLRTSKCVDEDVSSCPQVVHILGLTKQEGRNEHTLGFGKKPSRYVTRILGFKLGDLLWVAFII